MRRGSVVVLALGSACLLAVCSRDDALDVECRNLCRALTSCGLLPGPLGERSTVEDAEGRYDCETRCVLSESESIKDVLKCDDKLGAANPPGPSLLRWCDDGACSGLASCVDAELDASVRPSGSIDIRLSAGALVDPRTDADCNEDGTKGTYKGYRCGDALPSVRFFAESGSSVIFGDAQDCASAAMEGTSLGPLSVDVVRAGAELRVATDDGAPRCIVFWSERLPVSTRTSRIALVPVNSLAACEAPDPHGLGGQGGDGDDRLGCAPFTCEGDETTCSDALDNDGNGLPDCVDPKCGGALVCAPSVVEAE